MTPNSTSGFSAQITPSSTFGFPTEMAPSSASSSSAQMAPSSAFSFFGAHRPPPITHNNRIFDPLRLYPAGTDVDAIAQYDGHFTYVPDNRVAVSALPGVFHPNKYQIILAIATEISGIGSENPIASAALYYGPECSNNYAEVLAEDDVTYTREYANLVACSCALRTAQRIFVKRCILILQRDANMNRVVIKISSEILFRAMTEQVFAWEQNGWVTANGQPVEHHLLFARLQLAIKALNHVGVEVLFWLVPEAQNPAHALAEKELLGLLLA
jgi:ribonuclease HI